MAECGDRELTLDLMRTALRLLDRTGEAVAAARLQGAIDGIGLGRVQAVAEPTIPHDERTGSVAPRSGRHGGS